MNLSCKLPSTLVELAKKQKGGMSPNDLTFACLDNMYSVHCTRHCTDKKASIIQGWIANSTSVFS